MPSAVKNSNPFSSKQMYVVHFLYAHYMAHIELDQVELRSPQHLQLIEDAY